jgi:hypothetical protein
MMGLTETLTAGDGSVEMPLQTLTLPTIYEEERNEVSEKECELQRPPPHEDPRKCTLEIEVIPPYNQSMHWEYFRAQFSLLVLI